MSPIRGAEVDKFVREEGEWVLHSTGMRCFCLGKDGQLDPNCQAHDVTGAIYDEPKRIIGLFCDIMQRKELAATGLFLPGDGLFSPLRNASVAEGDKITFLKPLPIGLGDARMRGAGASDRLTYRGVSAIFCMDEDRVRYKEHTDFLLQDEGADRTTPTGLQKRIVWQWDGKPEEGVVPKIGVRYTIKYRAFIDWIAFFPPMERFSHGDDLGNKVMLRKLHVLAAQG